MQPVHPDLSNPEVNEIQAIQRQQNQARAVREAVDKAAKDAAKTVDAINNRTTPEPTLTDDERQDIAVLAYVASSVYAVPVSLLATGVSLVAGAGWTRSVGVMLVSFVVTFLSLLLPIARKAGRDRLAKNVRAPKRTE